MKSQKRSQSKSKSKSKSKTQLNASQTIDDSDIYRIIDDITLKHARTSYGIFVSENFQAEKKKDPSLKSYEIWKKLSQKWQNVSENKKKEYEKKSEEEREKFKRDLETVRHYLFGDYKKEGSTAYRLFLNSRLKEAFEKDEDPKDVKKKASEDWEKMSKEDKLEWKNEKKENDSWWEQAKKSRHINAYAVFVQKKIEEANENGEDTPNFKKCAKLWKQLNDKERKRYEDYADTMNEERKRMRELFEIANGIQPKKPAGAYKIFLSEKAKEGVFKGKSNVLKEGRKMWEKLTKEEKDDYLFKAKKIRLCYIYKKMLYKKNRKKILPSKPRNAYNFFVSSMKGKLPEKNESFMKMCINKWNKMTETEKERFQVLADNDRLKYEREMEKFKNRVFDFPKKPLNAFRFYLSEKLIGFNDVNVRKTYFKIMVEKWNKLSDKEKEIYEEKAEKDKKRFKMQNKEFKEFGYYTKSKEQKEDEKERKSQSQKRRSQNKSQSQKKSAKK
jgi:hypothetical protein